MLACVVAGLQLDLFYVELLCMPDRYCRHRYSSVTQQHARERSSTATVPQPQLLVAGLFTSPPRTCVRGFDGCLQSCSSWT